MLDAGCWMRDAGYGGFGDTTSSAWLDMEAREIDNNEIWGTFFNNKL
jgi:hypothetical protein